MIVGLHEIRIQKHWSGFNTYCLSPECFLNKVGAYSRPIAKILIFKVFYSAMYAIIMQQ